MTCAELWQDLPVRIRRVSGRSIIRPRVSKSLCRQSSATGTMEKKRHHDAQTRRARSLSRIPLIRHGRNRSVVESVASSLVPDRLQIIFSVPKFGHTSKHWRSAQSLRAHVFRSELEPHLPYRNRIFPMRQQHPQLQSRPAAELSLAGRQETSWLALGFVAIAASVSVPATGPVRFWKLCFSFAGAPTGARRSWLPAN